MKRCLNCRRTYDEDLTECPHCGYKPRSKSADTQDGANSRSISSNSSAYSEPARTSAKSAGRQRSISSTNKSAHAGSFYIQSGERLNNRYSVINVMGFGAFGVAYECFDNNTQRRVVVKEYMPSFLVNRASNGRDAQPISPEAEINFSIGVDAFIDESKKLSDNEIRCMPRMIEYFYQNSTSYVVTELVEGELLSSVIKRKHSLSYQASVSVITGVLQGIRQLNKVGVIHSDICPDNIVVMQGGETKLLDYNLSEFNRTIYTQRDSGKLRAGYSAIEMYYPEMAQGPWTDVYAAAATMYKMLTGITVPSAIKRSSNECLVPPSKLGVSITPGAEKAMLAALNVDPNKRTRNPEDFLNGLTGDGFDNLAADTSAQKELKISSKPRKKYKEKKRRDGNAVLNTILIFLLIAIIGVVIWLFISGVFTMPQFITDALGLGGSGSGTDSDTDILASGFVGDFYDTDLYSIDDTETDEDSETDTDTGNLLSDILEGLNSSDEDTSSEEDYDWNDYSSEEDYSSYYDYSSDYYDYDESSSSGFLDGVVSSIENAFSSIASEVNGYMSSNSENSSSDDYSGYYYYE